MKARVVGLETHKHWGVVVATPLFRRRSVERRRRGSDDCWRRGKLLPECVMSCLFTFQILSSSFEAPFCQESEALVQGCAPWLRRPWPRKNSETHNHCRVHSSVVRVADCRSAGPWFKSGRALHCGLTSSGEHNYRLDTEAAKPRPTSGWRAAEPAAWPFFPKTKPPRCKTIKDLLAQTLMHLARQFLVGPGLQEALWPNGYGAGPRKMECRLESLAAYTSFSTGSPCCDGCDGKINDYRNNVPQIAWGRKPFCWPSKSPLALMDTASGCGADGRCREVEQ